MLELDQVVKYYRTAGEQVGAVDGISLRLNAGEMIAVQGPSGSGKTTLLLLIAGLLGAERGTIRFAGRDIAGLSEDELSEYLMRDVGFMYQTHRLMPRVSALENAALKLLVSGLGPRAAQQRAEPWLRRLGLGERLSHTPEELSGGERQRVAIAQVLACEPRLILADEPTGSLDSARSLQTVQLLGELAHERGTAVLLVTHDAEAACLADRRYTLRDGRLRDALEPSADGGMAMAHAAASTAGGG